jgi:hypothetical protein
MIALVTLVALIATPAFAVSITLNGGSSSFIKSTAYDGTDYDAPSHYPASLPDSGTVYANGGESSATTSYTLSNEGFEFTFDHARTGTDTAYSESEGSLYFSGDSDGSYVLGGVYTAIDEQGRLTSMEVRLYDQTTRDYLFRNLQRSNTTPNESFTLGLEEGDLSSILVGSLTGTLRAGHEYQLYFRDYIYNGAAEATTLATATGTLSLIFAPEPSTFLLFASGLVGLAAVRRRRRS